MLRRRNDTRHGEGPSRDPVRTREGLVNAAFDEVHKSGFRGADVEAILKTTGVTRGALYHHFDGKDALGHAVVDEVIAGIMRERWVVPLSRATNVVDTLVKIVRSTSLNPEHVRRGCPLNNISQEMSPLDEGFRKRTGKIFGDWHDAVAVALREGKAKGTVRQEIEPDETAAFIIAAYEGYLSLAKNSQDPKQLRSGMGALAGYVESLRPQRGRRQQTRARATLEE